MSESPINALTQPSPAPQQPQQPTVAQPFESVQTGQLPGMTPGAFEAATQPMQVSPEIYRNPMADPAAAQHMILAAQGLQDFNKFTMRNNIARMVPGKRVKSFLRVPYGLFSPSQATQLGSYDDVPTDVYVPVMEDEDDKAAYLRYLHDTSTWNTKMLPYRMANYLADKLLPSSVETVMRMNPPTMNIPLALDNIRDTLARNAPIAGSERLDTERQFLTPDWTWAVFGGAMKGGETLLTAGMLRFAESGAGQAFMRGIQTSGLNKLAAEGLPFGESAGAGLLGPPAGRSTPLFEWLGQKVGVRAFSNVRPATLREAEAALNEAGARLRVTPQGLDVGLTGSVPNPQRLISAMRALKADMSAAGEKAAFRIFSDVPSTFGATVGGGAGAGLVGADPLARLDLTPEQRKAIALSLPGQIAAGAALPLGFRAAGAGLDALLRPRLEAPGVEPTPVEGTPSATGPMKYLTELPRREPPAPPGPPRILGEGPGPIGMPPAAPGPYGPSSPDSGLYSVPLPEVPVPETAGGMGSPSPEQFAVQQAGGVIQDMLPSVQDAKQLYEVRQFMQGLASMQMQQTGLVEAMGADPAVLEGRNKAVAARLGTITKLLGKDLGPTSFALGLPAESMLFDPNIPPEVNSIEPLRMGLFEWAHALGEEAQRAGLDLPTETAALPPPAMPWDLMTLTARLQGLASIIHQRNPNAPVGPPLSITKTVPEEVRKFPPSRVEPIRYTKVREGLPTASDFPVASELRKDPGAVRRQTLYAARAAHGLRFHAGDLVATKLDALRDYDPIRVPVYQDPSGRLLARIPAMSNDGLADVEITDTLTRAYLPETADWKFRGNPLAPVPYVLDDTHQLLQVDPNDWDKRDWIRNTYKQGLWRQVQGEVDEGSSPFNNPVTMVQSLVATPPATLDGADATIAQIEAAAAAHKAKRPTLAMAKVWAGPGASDAAANQTYGEMLREHASMGMLIEHARALALQQRTSLIDQLTPPDTEAAEILPGGLALLAERDQIEPQFFSKLIRTLQEVKAESWQPDQLINFLKGRGIKNVEILATGLEAALKELAAERPGKGVKKADIISKLSEPQLEALASDDWGTYIMKGPTREYNGIVLRWDGPLVPDERKKAQAADEPAPQVLENVVLDKDGNFEDFKTLERLSAGEYGAVYETTLMPDFRLELQVDIYNDTLKSPVFDQLAPETEVGSVMLPLRRSGDVTREVSSSDTHYPGVSRVIGFYRYTKRQHPETREPMLLIEEYQRGQWLTALEDNPGEGVTPFQDTWKNVLLRHALLKATQEGVKYLAWSSPKVIKKRYAQLVRENVARVRWTNVRLANDDIFRRTYASITKQDYLDALKANPEDPLRHIVKEKFRAQWPLTAPSKAKTQLEFDLEYATPDYPEHFRSMQHPQANNGAWRVGDLENDFGATYGRQIRDRILANPTESGTLDMEGGAIQTGMAWADDLYSRLPSNEYQRLARANGWGDVPIKTLPVVVQIPSPEKVDISDYVDYPSEVHNLAARQKIVDRYYTWSDDAVLKQLLAVRGPDILKQVVEARSEVDEEKVREEAEERYTVDEVEAQYDPGWLLGYMDPKTATFRAVDAEEIVKQYGLDPDEFLSKDDYGAEYSDNQGDHQEAEQPYFYNLNAARRLVSTLNHYRALSPLLPEAAAPDWDFDIVHDAFELSPARWEIYDNDRHYRIAYYTDQDDAYEHRSNIIDGYIDDHRPNVPDDFGDLIRNYTDDETFKQIQAHLSDEVDDIYAGDRPKAEALADRWNKGAYVSYLEQSGIPLPEEAKPKPPITEDVQGIEITEKMAEQVMTKGIALFMAREGNKAQTRFDPRLVGVLGASQYSGDIGRIVVKELLQNAKDSLLAALEQGWTRSKPAVLRLNINIGAKEVQIIDNGIGMSPEVASEEFVEIGGSFKPAQGSSGGFGLAKLAFLPNAAEIHVQTVADTPQGRMVTTLTGTGDMWADSAVGLDIDVRQADATEQPGTEIRLKMKPEIDFYSYSINDFLRPFRESSELPFEFHYIRDGEIQPSITQPRQELLTLPGDGWEAAIAVLGEKPQTGQTASLLIGNNGIYQFTSTYYGNEGAQVPENIWVNIKPQVPVTDPRYPFTSNREAVKDVVKQAINAAVTKDIAAVQQQRTIAKANEIIDDAYLMLADPQSRLVDTMLVLPDELQKKITQNPEMGLLAKKLREYHDRMLSMLQTFGLHRVAYQNQPSEWLGLAVSGKYYGVNLYGVALQRPKSTILINPFVAMVDLQAFCAAYPNASAETRRRWLAGSWVGTLVHEISHQEVRSDTAEAFGGALTANMGTLTELMTLAKDDISLLLEANNGRLYSTLEQLAEEVRSYWGQGSDIFDHFATNLARRGQGGVNQGGASGGRGSRRGQSRTVPGGGEAPPSGNGPDASVRGSEAGPEAAAARLRAEALANAAAGGGWSGKRGTQLFHALTDDEKFDAILSRLLSGRILNRRHLMNLSPQKWEAKKKFPSYFKTWAPTPAQMDVLKDAFNKRLEWYNRSEQTLGRLKTAAEQRKTGGRPDWIDLESIQQIDPSHLEDMYDNPDTLDEWVNNFWRVIDPLTDEAKQEPDDTKRATMLQQLDLLKDAVRTMTGDRIVAGIHPYDDPPTAYSGMKRIQVWSHNAQAIASGALRRIGRPSYVIGWRKQILHPKEFAQNKEMLARSVFHLLDTAKLNMNRDLERVISETDELHLAASQWMRRRKPLEAADAMLNLNAAPPTDIPKDVLLDRSIYTFLRHRTPVTEIERSPYRYHSIPVGKLGLVSPTKVDLAEWMPKLYQTYDYLIEKAEQSELLKAQAEAVKYKAKGEGLEAELQGRILREAQEQFPSEGFQEFQAIPIDLVAKLMQGLAASDEGNSQADPWSLGARPFRSIKSAWQASLRQYRDRNEHISYIKDGGLRREGYVTAVHKIALEEVRNMLRDSNSVYARYTSPEVKNYYLNERKSDTEPYHSWAVSWLLYVPAMMKTIHMQPAFTNTAPLIPQLPADLRNYADQMVRRLKGEQTPFDEMMNRLAFQSMVESPSLASEMGKIFGKDLLEQLRTDPEARKTLVGTKPWTKMIEGLAGGAYLALMSPLKVAALNVTEAGFLMHEYMKRPIDLVPGVGIIPYAIARSGFEGIREFASWTHQMGFGGPRWYSEATLMGVTDALNELTIERHAHPHPFRFLQNASEFAVQMWYAALRATQQPVNAMTYYTMKANAKMYGLDEDDARYYAARITKDLAGLYGPMDTPPNPRGTTGRAVFQFKRFLAAKTDLLLGDVTNASRLFMTPNEMNVALGHGGGSPPPSVPPGLAPLASPGDGPPPPPFKGSSFGAWTPEEQDAWENLSQPVAPFGAVFKSPRIAQWRAFLAFLGLVVAAYPAIGTVALIAKLFWDEDDEARPGQNIFDMAFPWDFRRINSIPMMWWVEYVGRIGMLEIKKHAPMTGGLTVREENELAQRKRTMVESAWVVGDFLKAQRYKAQEDEREMKRNNAIQQRLSRPGGATRPRRPSRKPAAATP